MLHFHGTPIGGTRQGVAQFMQGRFAFIPAGRQEDLGVAAEHGRGFAFDNGAFSAWNAGEPIEDWGDYYRLVKLWYRHPRFHFAIIPDTIDGSEEDNRDLQIEWYRKIPIEVPAAPVWHLHESLEYLERMVSHSPLIALGSSGRWSTPGTDSWWDRIGEAMRIICNEDGQPKVRIHGLRMLNPQIFSRIPFWSADSTNVAQNRDHLQRYGMYTPPESWQRCVVNAQRIESVNSPAMWQPSRQMEFQY